MVDTSDICEVQRAYLSGDGWSTDKYKKWVKEEDSREEVSLPSSYEFIWEFGFHTFCKYTFENKEEEEELID